MAYYLDVGLVCSAVKSPLVESGIGIETLAVRVVSNFRSLVADIPSLQVSLKQLVHLPGASGAVLVVGPRDSLLAQLLEDALLGHGEVAKVGVVPAVTVAGTGGDVGPVRVGRARDGAEPAVEQHVVLGHSGEDGDVLRGVVVDGLGRTVPILGLVGDGLLSNESVGIR